MDRQLPALLQERAVRPVVLVLVAVAHLAVVFVLDFRRERVESGIPWQHRSPASSTRMK